MSDGKITQLFDGQSADTTGSETGEVLSFRGNKANIFASGTFGGGALTIETQSPDGSWIEERDLTGSAFSSTTNEIIPLGNIVYGQKIRAQLNGSTSPDLNVWVVRVALN